MSKESTEITRPTFEQIYMRLAFSLAERSTCSRKKVGSVISTTDFRQIIAIGYNGNASGLPNHCDFPDESGSCGCLHSVDNLCLSCSSPRETKKIVFITAIPCRMCSKRLINLGGVIKVYFSQDYRDRSGLDLLESVGIVVENLILS